MLVSYKNAKYVRGDDTKWSYEVRHLLLAIRVEQPFSIAWH